MNRRIRTPLVLTLCLLTVASGCMPKQPIFFSEDGQSCLVQASLSHYMNVATEIEYPDVLRSRTRRSCQCPTTVVAHQCRRF